jgi:hypothetical protein
MNLRTRFFLAATLAGTVATPALAETTAPLAGLSGSRTQNTAPIPDFSGFWLHPGLGFGPPLSGPGPVQNTIRLPSGASNVALLVGDYANPILKPEAAEVVRKFGEISLSGRIFADPDSLCLQNPVPYILWNFFVQLLQQPDKVTLIYQHDSDFRTVKLNQTHPATVIPSLHGDSVGHYQGDDTLVVDTVGIKVGPHRMIDRFGTPYTQALHVVERYRLLERQAAKEALAQAEKEWPRVGGAVDPNWGKGLQLEFTVEDPGVFTMPWSATITYGRNVHQSFEERICAENVQRDYEYNYFSDKNARLPTAGKPDF